MKLLPCREDADHAKKVRGHGARTRNSALAKPLELVLAFERSPESDSMFQGRRLHSSVMTG